MLASCRQVFRLEVLRAKERSERPGLRKKVECAVASVEERLEMRRS